MSGCLSTHFLNILRVYTPTVEANLAVPKRPQDRVLLSKVQQAFNATMELWLEPATIEKERLDSESGGMRIFK